MCVQVYSHAHALEYALELYPAEFGFIRLRIPPAVDPTDFGVNRRLNQPAAELTDCGFIRLLIQPTSVPTGVAEVTGHASCN